MGLSAHSLIWLQEDVAFDCMVSVDEEPATLYTVVIGDTAEIGAELWARGIAGDFGTIAPAVPRPPSVPEEISRRQFFQGLAEANFITYEEALAALDGTMPAILMVIIDAIVDPKAKFEALAHLKGSTVFGRTHPLVPIFAATQGMSEADVDDFWRMCAALL